VSYGLIGVVADDASCPTAGRARLGGGGDANHVPFPVPRDRPWQPRGCSGLQGSTGRDSLSHAREEEPPVIEAAEQESGLVAAEPSPMDEKILLQRIYSAELISLFGSDYISLEPDYKQMLSYIYERNHLEQPIYPLLMDICSDLWVIRGEVNAPNAFELYQLQVKKILASMEKTGFVARYKGKQGYKVNTTYEVVKNLFN
jgi:hypothetical protein